MAEVTQKKTPDGGTDTKLSKLVTAAQHTASLTSATHTQKNTLSASLSLWPAVTLRRV